MRDWWKDAGTTSTGGFITETELAACAVTAAKLNASAVTSSRLSTDSVTTDKITDANVTSCKISTNALYRSIAIPFPKLLTTEAASLLSSTYVVYMPVVPMNIQRVSIITQAAWQNATCDHFTLFRNSSSCVANVAFTSLTTAISAGVRSCTDSASVTNALIAANTVLTFKTNVSTCSVSAAATLVIDYITTG